MTIDRPVRTVIIPADEMPAGRTKKIRPPRLRPIEQTLFILMSDPGTWYLVDEFSGTTSHVSSMRNNLWRRGCDVRIMKSTGYVVEVWARWTHPVPTEIGPWTVR